MKKLDDLHINTNTLKIDQMTKKDFGWAWSKMFWAVWSRDSKNNCISRMSRWN